MNYYRLLNLIFIPVSWQSRKVVAWCWPGETLIHSSDSIIWDYQNLQENVSSIDLAEILKKTVSASRNSYVMLGWKTLVPFFPYLSPFFPYLSPSQSKDEGIAVLPWMPSSQGSHVLQSCQRHLERSGHRIRIWRSFKILNSDLPLWSC